MFSTAALFQLLQKQQNCLHSSAHLVYFPFQLLSSTAKKENAWKLGFSCLPCITDPLLLDVKIHVVLVHPYILGLTVLVNVSQPGKEPPAALAQLDPCGGGLWSVAFRACKIRHKVDRLLHGGGRWQGSNALFGFHKGKSPPRGPGEGSWYSPDTNEPW